jgi:hypothetical protein
MESLRNSMSNKNFNEEQITMINSLKESGYELNTVKTLLETGYEKLQQTQLFALNDFLENDSKP